MISRNIKDTIAKFVVLLWIILLIILAVSVIRFAIFFDVNAYFNLPEGHKFGASIVREVQVLVLMLAVSIVGGVSFMIKDFYRSIKYANLFSVVCEDYLQERFSKEEFQKLITFEIYTGRFNYTWTYWFLIQPILSSILGLIAFAIARSGLGVLQGGSALSGEITIQSLYLYAVFTFLAGFSSHKFIAWLDRLASKIFETTLPAEKLQAQKDLVVKTTTTELENMKDSVDITEESDIISEGEMKPIR